MSTLLFLRDVARNPARMGSVVPSSARLAQAMADCADIQPGHVVVELGAGTGAFTRELVERHPRNRLVVFEVSATLAGPLERSFPTVTVVARPAEALPEVMAELGLGRIDRVVSGLPWALWGAAQQARILDGLVPYLAPSARLVTFHDLHSRALGRVRTTRGLLVERFHDVSFSAPVWRNLPPALVHVAARPRAGTAGAA